MFVKDLIAQLSKADPYAEVVIEDYNQGFLAGVEETLVMDVYPWDGETYTQDGELTFVIRQTHETVASHKPGDE